MLREPLKQNTLFLWESPLGQEEERSERLRKFVACQVGLQVPRGFHSKVSEEGTIREVVAAGGSDSAGSLRSEGGRVVGRSCDVGPHSPLPEDSPEVQRVQHEAPRLVYLNQAQHWPICKRNPSPTMFVMLDISSTRCMRLLVIAHVENSSGCNPV